MIPHALAIRLITLSDQVFFSVANFLLTVLLARAFSDEELASFGVAVSTALLLQSSLRNCYIVQNSVLPAPVFLKRARAVIGQQMVIVGGILLIELIGFALCYWLAPSLFSWEITLSTAVTTLLYIQLEFDRMVNVKFKRYWNPFVTSFLFLLLNGSLFLAVPHFGLTFDEVMIAIAIFALGKIIWLIISVGGPRLRLGWRLTKRDAKRYLASSIVGAVGYAGFTHVPMFVLNATAPALHAAAYVAIRGLTQPLQIVVKSLDLVDKSLFHAHAGASGMRRVMLRQLALYGGLGVVTILAIALLGEWLVELIYGPRYAEFYLLYLGWGVVLALLAIDAPMQTVIVRQGRLNSLNHQRLIAGAVGGAAAFLLCPKLGAYGATISVILGWLASTVSSLWLTRDVWRRQIPLK